MTSRAHDEPGVFRAIAEFTYDWESWIGADGRLSWVNAAVERITGHTVDDCFAMEGYPLPLIHEADRARMARLFEDASRGHSGNDVEFRVRRPDGEIRWCAVAWQPIVGPRGRPLGYRTSVRDIQERKLAEAQLLEAKHAAEAADRAKSEFLATVSHELRSPLQSLMGYAELLDQTPLNAEQRRFLGAIARQNSALLRLVNDLLDLGALQRSELALVPTDFSPAELLRSVVDDARSQAEARGLAFRLQLRGPIPTRARTDAGRLRQVFTNLVGNAIKFTEAGAVTVSARVDAGLLVVAVRDTGPGIAPDKRARIFEPFFQADTSLARRYGGSGLGLAIAQRLTLLMGGAITYEAPRSGGSRFVVRVPLDRPIPLAGPRSPAIRPAKAKARAPKSAPASARERSAGSVADGTAATPVVASKAKRAKARALRILFVDDDPLTLDVASRFAKALGHRAETAASGRAGVALGGKTAFDLILLDLQMPDLDGAEVARKLRAQLGPRCPPLVAVTANVFTEQLSERALFDDVLNKPYSMAQLDAFLAAHASPRLIDARVLDDVRSISGGGAGLEALLARFRGDVRAELRKLEAALARGRGTPAADHAHRLKGIALAFGATALAGLASRVEAEAREGRLSKATRAARGLGSLLDETMSAFALR